MYSYVTAIWGDNFEREQNLLYPRHSEDRHGLSEKDRIILTFPRPQRNLGQTLGTLLLHSSNQCS